MEMLLPLPREVEGLVDDPNVHNPLQRMERLGTGWFGVLVEHDGVLFQDSTEAHTEAWLQVAKELGYQRPLGHLFRRVKGLRDDVVVTAVFNWTQNPSVARTIADLKVQKYAALTADRNPQPVMLEAGPFLRTLKTYNIPVGLACGSLSASVVHERMKHAKLDTLIDTVVTGDDGGATEVEWYFMDAAAQIGRPPMRCILIGNSSNSIEVARELGMKCVVLAGNTPVYNFASADLVVRDLSQLTFSNLKKLFGQEGLVEPRLGDGGSSGESAESSSGAMDRDGSAWGSSMQSNMDAWDDDNDDEQFDDGDSGGVGDGSSSGYSTGLAFSHR
ncbi:hypothetical protein FOA52_002821 [Chlamydomonas sp. UWO 241]|nr:hypothetical protein FOA52_002821 [Chlamydomonas sp. UWO 241]